jgi:hypothetical protein
MPKPGPAILELESSMPGMKKLELESSTPGKSVPRKSLLEENSTGFKAPLSTLGFVAASSEQATRPNETPMAGNAKSPNFISDSFFT